MIALKKLHCVKEELNMNKGTEELQQVLKVLDNMSVEEYEQLYDEVCEQYGDTEPLCVLGDSLDIHSLTAQMYNADSDIEVLSSVTSMLDIYGYVPENDGTVENVNTTKITQLFFNINIVNSFFNRCGNEVKFYATR